MLFTVDDAKQWAADNATDLDDDHAEAGPVQQIKLLAASRCETIRQSRGERSNEQ